MCNYQITVPKFDLLYWKNNGSIFGIHFQLSIVKLPSTKTELWRSEPNIERPPLDVIPGA